MEEKERFENLLMKIHMEFTDEDFITLNNYLFNDLPHNSEVVLIKDRLNELFEK